MTDHEITATAWHEAGHHVAALHFKIPSYPVVTPEGHYNPGSTVAHSGVCYLDQENTITPWQGCVIGWAGILAQALAGLRHLWMPPFKPTARDLKDWHSMMLFRRGELSEGDQKFILGCASRSWPACKTAYRILRREMPRLRRMAKHTAAAVRKDPAKMDTKAGIEAGRTSRAQFLETHLAGLKPDAPDRARLTEILAYLKRGEEPPANLFAPPGDGSK